MPRLSRAPAVDGNAAPMILPKIDGLLPHDFLLYYLARVYRYLPLLRMTPYHRFLAWKERALWRRYYLPPSKSVKGATILDGGAGCGETADFYFRHGAEKVICVEAAAEPFTMLSQNAKSHGWNVELIHDYLSAEDIERRDYDYAKIDCTGVEDYIRYWGRVPRGVIEIHGNENKSWIERRLGYSSWRRVGQTNWLLLNWS